MKKLIMAVIAVLAAICLMVGFVGCNVKKGTIGYYLKQEGYGKPYRIIIAESGYSSHIDFVEDEKDINTLYKFFSPIECEQMSYEEFQSSGCFLTSGMWVEFCYEGIAITIAVRENGVADFIVGGNVYLTKENAVDYAVLIENIERMGIKF